MFIAKGFTFDFDDKWRNTFSELKGNNFMDMVFVNMAL